MKKFHILAAGMALTLFASCQQSGDNVLSQATSPADSLMYYFGQMRAMEYIRQSDADTTFKESAVKQAYIQGVQAGISGVRDDDDAYNQGFYLGMQMAMSFQKFQEQYGMVPDKRIFVLSLQEAINSDSLPNNTEIQGNFYRIMGQLNAEKEEKEKAAAVETVSKMGQSLGMKEISEELYGKVTTPTDGEALKDGDEVTIVTTVTDEAGKELQAPMSPKGKVGARTLPKVISEALKTMKNGETGEFVTSAHALFGQRAQQMDLKPESVLTLTIKADLVKEEESKQLRSYINKKCAEFPWRIFYFTIHNYKS